MILFGGVVVTVGSILDHVAFAMLCMHISPTPEAKDMLRLFPFARFREVFDLGVLSFLVFNFL